MVRILIMIAIGVGVLLILPTHAEARCPAPGPPRSDVFPSWIHTGETSGNVGQYLGGIYSTIYNTAVWVEPSRAENFSASWVGIGQYPSNYMWAQAGWIEYRYNRRQDYYEWFETDNYNTRHYREFPPQPWGASTTYTVLYNYTGSSQVAMYHAGVLMNSGVVGWVPNRWDVSAEVNTPANQMPGGYGDFENFGQLWTYLGDHWTVPSFWTPRWEAPGWTGLWAYRGGLSTFDRQCYN